MAKSSNASNTVVAVLTADPAFEQSVSATFGASGAIELRLVRGTVASVDNFATEGATVVVVDLDAARPEEMVALEHMMLQIGVSPPVVVVTQSFDAEVARSLLQMRVADFLVKPVQPIELVRTCARVARSAVAETKEAQIYTFIPAVGGAGVTTLAIQTALLLLNSGQRVRPTVCLVDLDFQHGACADYLDLEPRLDLKEIEPRPERLDRQLLEIMLSHHASGLEVIAAPNRPAEMRSFDPDMVTRLLDLVSSHFDYVVIDMPRTWFSWTDSVLLGSNRTFIVSEMTVPSIRQAKALVAAIRERLGDGPQPRVVVNRFEQRMFDPGLKKADIEQALGDGFAGTIPNNYRLVREAIDRGVPLDEVKAGNNITTQLKKLMLPQIAKTAAPVAGLVGKLGFSLAKSA
ncbi:MAG: CpaE family protein [Bradyrhizobium canariense]